MFDFPNAPTSGQIISGPNGASWQWDGVKWQANALWQGATVIVSDVAPTNPPSGALWWDSVGGQLYLNYQDPTSREWVIANSGGIPDAPTDGTLYARRGQQWVGINGAFAAPGNVGRNYVQNSMFNIWQRGAGPWTTDYTYTADRWPTNISGDTASFGQGQFNDTQRVQQIGDETATYYLFANFTGTSGAAAQTGCMHPIENVRRLAGKTVILSFWATAWNGATKMGVTIGQYMGTGGSPSAGVVLPGQLVNLTSGFVRYSLTFTLPSLNGKTIGTNNNSHTYPQFFFSAGANNAASAGNVGVQSGSIALYGVQLEVAQPGQTQPTPLEKLDPEKDLANCQRYYQVGQFNACGWGGYVDYAWALPVQMRAVPTLTPNWTSTTNNTNYGMVAYTGSHVCLYGQGSSVGTVYFQGTYTAVAEL